MSEPPYAPTPPAGASQWRPPDVSDEWSPIPEAGTPPPPIAPGPQPAWGSAQHGGWPEWMPAQHPTTAGALLQRIFSTVVAAPRIFLGLVAQTWVVAAPPLAVATFWSETTDPVVDDASDWASIIVPFAAIVGVVFVQWIVVAGTLTGVAAHPVARVRAGSRPAFDDTLRYAWRALPRLLAWTVLLGFAVAAAFTPAVALFGLGAASGGFVLLTGSLLLALVALVPVAWLLVRTVFTAPAIVLDGLTVREAVARSGSLAAQRFWRTFGVLAVMLVLAWVAMTTMMYPFDLLGSFAGAWFDDADADTYETVVSVVGSVVASIVVQPVLTVVPAVLYDDARAAESAATPAVPGRGDR